MVHPRLSCRFLVALLGLAGAAAASSSTPAPVTTAVPSLRGAAAAATTAKPEDGSDVTTQDEEAADDSSTTSPGASWERAAEAADAVPVAFDNMTTTGGAEPDLEELELPNQTAMDSYTAQGGGRRPHGSSGGSCYEYKCGGYRSWQACQCNEKCKAYGNCCSDFRPRCTPHPVKLMTVYHQTSKEIGHKILNSNFRPGSKGWCGGAIYFAKTPEATFTKAIGPDSHTGFMIEAVVDVGLVWYEGATCGNGAMNQQRLERLGFDSVRFNPGDGDEIVIYDPRRIKSKRQVPIPHH